MNTKRKSTPAIDLTPPCTIELNLTAKHDYATPEEFAEWKTDGAIYAKMLARRDCPVAFRTAFTALFCDHLLNECDPTHPRWIAAFFPLVIASLQSSIPADALRMVDALKTLRETLAPELTEEVLAELKEGTR